MKIVNLAEAFKALGDETRLTMVAMLLWADELCVCDFERFLKIGQSSASRHLRQLKIAGWVQDRRDGIWIRYRIKDDLPKELASVLDALRQVFAHRKYSPLRKALRQYLKAKAETSGACPVTQ